MVSLECTVLLTSCGKLNGCCFMYDVQHVESCLNPSVAFLNGLTANAAYKRQNYCASYGGRRL